MPDRLRASVAPLYLFACLILGGSAQGIWQNMLLQLVGLGLIAWAAAAGGPQPLAPAARHGLILAAAGVGVIVMQLVPLPADFASGGPRGELVRGLALLGSSSGALPLSTAPYSTLGALFALLPPLGMFCAMVALNAYRPRWLAAALMAGALGGILIGALQVTSADPRQSPWYLYPATNFGFGVGFFANANHMATLLLITLPFLAALAAAAKTGNLQRYSGILAIIVGAVILVVFGIALNGSLAGFGLALPVAAASMLIVLPSGSRGRTLVALVGGGLLIAAVIGLASSAIGSSTFGRDAASSVQSREEILQTTGRAIADFMPMGSGAGSFQEVYPLYEEFDRITRTYVIHAHNDYAELVLELGMFGIVLILAFFAWWGAAVWRVWRTAEAGPFARAASVASAAILVHSLVDFPLRTAAISTAFAMCLALMAGNRAPRAHDASDLRPTRHVVLK